MGLVHGQRVDAAVPCDNEYGGAMWIRAFAVGALTACASTPEPAVGVSTAPQSVPARVAAQEPDAVPPSVPEPAKAASPPHVALGRLHPITSMSAGSKKLDAKVLIARIESQPDRFDACSTLASAEANAPEGTWNVRLTLAAGVASLRVESPVDPAFAQCLERAAARLTVHGLPPSEIMLLLGLER